MEVHMRTSIVKIAAQAADHHRNYANDTFAYSTSALAGGLVGTALMRGLGEHEHDIKHSQMRGIGYGLVGSVAGGMTGAAVGGYGGLVAGSALGMGLGNAHLNEKIRLERLKNKRK